MDRLDITEGVRVVGADDITIGTVDTVDSASQPPTLLVRLDGSDEIVGISAGDVDFQGSTERAVRLTIPGADLMRSAEATEGDDDGHMTIPVHAEELVPHRREEQQGRVIIHKRVETHPVEEQIELEREVVEIERVPIGEDIDDVPAVRQEGDTTVVPLVEEILVIEKRLRLVEEVRITKRVETETETIRDELRREVVDVDEERAGDPDRGRR